MAGVARDRLARIAEIHGRALLASLGGESARPREAAAGAVEAFSRYDPTANKACTQWLVRCFIAGGFRHEDLQKAKETLEHFVTYRRRLPEGQRDLNRYPTLASVWKAVEPLVLAEAPASNREEDSRLREQARAESRILLEREDGLTLAVPLTERASQWWGRGTRWCTAAEKNNMFAEYHKDAPLYVIILPGGTKLQLWVHQQRKEIQFMDAADAGADEALVRDHWGYLKDILIPLAWFYPGLAMRWPAEHLTQEACLRAVEDFGDHLADVPEHFRTREVCSAATRNSLWALRHVPEDLLTKPMILAAIQTNRRPNLFHYVPDRLLDEDFIAEVLRVSPISISSVPSEHCTARLCRIAVENAGLNFLYIPDRFRSKELFELVIDEHPYYVSKVRHELLDEAICLRALAHARPDIVRYFPPGMLSPEFIDRIVEAAPSAVLWLPVEKVLSRHWMAALPKAPEIWMAIPPPLRTAELEALRPERPFADGSSPPSSHPGNDKARNYNAMPSQPDEAGDDILPDWTSLLEQVAQHLQEYQEETLNPGFSLAP